MPHYSNDPYFETEAANIIGLYLNPAQNAGVFCVDEKTAIQALDRKDPVLPLSSLLRRRHEKAGREPVALLSGSRSRLPKESPAKVGFSLLAIPLSGLSFIVLE